jgi:hypothetical protein
MSGQTSRRIIWWRWSNQLGRLDLAIFASSLNRPPPYDPILQADSSATPRLASVRTRQIMTYRYLWLALFLGLGIGFSLGFALGLRRAGEARTDAPSEVQTGAIPKPKDSKDTTQDKRLPFSLPQGHCAITLRVTMDGALAGFIVPGTQVDFFTVARDADGSEHTRKLMSNVLVLLLEHDPLPVEGRRQRNCLPFSRWPSSRRRRRSLP